MYELCEVVGDRHPERWRYAYPAAHYGEEGQEHHRPRHDPGRLPRLPRSLRPRLTGEREEDGAEDVEGRQEHRQERHAEEHVVVLLVGRGHDGVLGPETGERNNAREREPRYDHRPESYGHPASQAPHLEQVIGVHGVDDAARAEEEKRLEER